MRHIITNHSGYNKPFLSLTCSLGFDKSGMTILVYQDRTGRGKGMNPLLEFPLTRKEAIIWALAILQHTNPR